MSFRLPSLVILALIEAEIAGRGRICPPFPGRVIFRPFPVRVLKRHATNSGQGNSTYHYDWQVIGATSTVGKW